MTQEKLAEVRARIQEFMDRLKEKEAALQAAVTNEDRTFYRKQKIILDQSAVNHLQKPILLFTSA